ncbi:hypothetical protein C4D60_Mb07t03110 [Musa balbisiana]|uniref:Uncharacterized protein n=1 Tax=Musa balbisiana TaxID=52838 RepID=A0A4S8JEG1_MUSBA|nr:hypothetical protein C4D60_Mb07t03110 [Musa balbisiana]
MDCQQQQPTRPEERVRHKFHSSPHLTESNPRRRRHTSSLTSPSSDRLVTPATMKGSGAVTIASTVITAAASYSTAVSGSSLPDPPKQQSADQEEQRRRSSEDRFAPRFDGLRFIETLITAHR